MRAPLGGRGFAARNGRRAVVAVGALAAGIGAALVMAAACAVWSPQPAPMVLVRTMGHWPAPMPDDVDPRPTMVRGADSFGLCSYRSAGVLRRVRVGVFQSVILAGWPFHALSASAAEGWSAPGSAAAATWLAPVYSVPPKVQSFLRMRRAEVPLHPVWKGLALDSLFFAFCFALPVPAFRAARRVARRRRGSCALCGYDLRACMGPCPECGGRDGANPRDGGAHPVPRVAP
ncbi:MAG: hypothetical protein IT437_06310 [Phycisphaerales bacterium]|nr:hypothetical protein [Phycisphaerales bacterium]